MYQQIRAFGVFDDIFVIDRVAGENNGTTLVFDFVAKGGIRTRVLNLERR